MKQLVVVGHYRHYLKGDEVYCLSFTDGVSARDKVKKKI